MRWTKPPERVVTTTPFEYVKTGHDPTPADKVRASAQQYTVRGIIIVLYTNNMFIDIVGGLTKRINIQGETLKWNIFCRIFYRFYCLYSIHLTRIETRVRPTDHQSNIVWIIHVNMTPERQYVRTPEHKIIRVNIRFTDV